MYDPMGFEEQPNRYSCGTCSFVYAALALGHVISYDDAELNCKTISSYNAVKKAASIDLVKWYNDIYKLAGTDPRGIMSAIMKLGWSLERFNTYDINYAKSVLDTHLSQGHPLIISTENGSHWQTILGIVNNSYVVVDSAGDTGKNIIKLCTFEQLIKKEEWFEVCETCGGNGCNNCHGQGFSNFGIVVIGNNNASKTLISWLPNEIKGLMKNAMLQEYWGYYLNDLQYCFEDGGSKSLLVHEFLTAQKNNIVNAVSDSLEEVSSKEAELELNNYITVARSYRLKYQSKRESEFYAYFIATFIGMFIDEYDIG